VVAVMIVDDGPPYVPLEELDELPGPFRSQFKNELDRIARPHIWGQSDAELLDRLVRHSRTKKVWDKIQSKARGPIHLEDLVQIVVLAHAYSRSPDPNISGFERHISERRRSLKTEGMAVLSAELPDIDRLEEIIARLRELHRVWPHPPQPSRRIPVSRSDREGSRARKIYAWTISHWVHRHCGLWLHDEVATLTDIAFPRPETTSVEQIKHFLSPTTKKGRQPK
jgi:hypothetical protein